MKYVEVTDEWLYKYMPIVDAAIIQELESRIETEYEFSRKFEHRMKRLIRREEHHWIGMVQNVMKRVAVFLVGLIGAALICTMSVEAYRVKFFETIKTIFEDAFKLSYHTEMDSNKLVSREPIYIPDGYQEVERTGNENYLSIIYENDEGELLLWDQMLVTDGGSLTFDLEYEQEDSKVINGSIATVFLYEEGYKSLYYECEEYSYMVVTESLDKEELYRMIESIFGGIIVGKSNEEDINITELTQSANKDNEYFHYISEQVALEIEKNYNITDCEIAINHVNDEVTSVDVYISAEDIESSEDNIKAYVSQYMDVPIEYVKLCLN